MRTTISIFLALVFTITTTQAQANLDQFFQDANQVFKEHVKNNAVNYNGIKKDAKFTSLIKTISITNANRYDVNTKKAYLINAYNLLVINNVIKNNITNSVQDKAGFFDNKTNLVNGKKMSLNNLEKEFILKEFSDARFHFVLVCGAKGCPPIVNFAYTPNQVDAQMEAQTREAINDSNFIKVNGSKTELSQIFKWYAADFGGSKKNVLAFINGYRTSKIPSSNSVSYYVYDWSLNSITSTSSTGTIGGGGNNATRYVVSAAIPKGTTETKIFNNLYTQKTRSSADTDFNARSNFFTTSLSFLYGVNNRFNAGFNLRYRRVSNTNASKSPLNVFGGDADSRRSGFTNIGPQIRWAPFEKLSNFSLQSSFVFPIGKDLQSQPFIDWDGATWNTQLFNDIPIGSSFSIFTEIDFLLEDIGKKSEGDLNRFSTPATLIFSYFPNPKTTIYALGNYSPFWQSDFDYFAQAGLGFKYQVTPRFEIEALYSSFTNKFLADTNGQASTFNLGIRISR